MKRGEEEGILKQLWVYFRRVRKGSKAEDQEGEEGINKENSEED